MQTHTDTTLTWFPCPEWEHCSGHRSETRLHLRGGHTEGDHRGDHHHHNGTSSHRQESECGKHKAMATFVLVQ